MIKVSVFLTRHPGLTHKQFIQYWKDKHAPLVMSLHGFRSHIGHYTQQHSLNNVPGGLPILPYDGDAEVWFEQSAKKEMEQAAAEPKALTIATRSSVPTF